MRYQPGVLARCHVLSELMRVEAATEVLACSSSHEAPPGETYGRIRAEILPRFALLLSGKALVGSDRTSDVL